MHACAGKYPVQVTSVSRLSNPVAIVTWAYLCIDIPGGMFASGARIQQYKCNGTAPAQKFNITQFLGESAWNRSDGPVYRIQTAADQLCWTVPEEMTEGIHLQLRACRVPGNRNNGTQLFQFLPTAGLLHDV